MYYEKLRELICAEEEIRNDLLELRETTEEWYEVIIKDVIELELRHILWYIKIRIWEERFRHFDLVNMYIIIWLPDFSKPPHEQEEACERIYDYLITL